MNVEVTLHSSPSYSFAISASCDRGDRSSMEDRVCVHHGFTKHGLLDFLLLGLFDGHAGDEAAQCAKEILPIKVDRLLRRGWDEEKALRQAFHDTNEQMLQEMSKQIPPRLTQCLAADGVQTLRESCRHLSAARLIATEADYIRNSFFNRPSAHGHLRERSRLELEQLPVLVCCAMAAYGLQIAVTQHVFWEFALEGSSWYPAGIRATSPHSVNARERARIARDGGQVAVDSRGDARVVFTWCNRHCWARQSRCSHLKRHHPCLNITRSLGDFWSFSSDTGRFAISCDPDIRSFSIADDNIFAFCLHSDGVALSPGHIVRLMNSRSSEEKENASKVKSGNLAAELLLHNRNYLKTRRFLDNATSLVVLINTLLVN